MAFLRSLIFWKICQRASKLLFMHQVTIFLSSLWLMLAYYVLINANFCLPLRQLCMQQFHFHYLHLAFSDWSGRRGEQQLPLSASSQNGAVPGFGKQVREVGRRRESGIPQLPLASHYCGNAMIHKPQGPGRKPGESQPKPGPQPCWLPLVRWAAQFLPSWVARTARGPVGMGTRYKEDFSQPTSRPHRLLNCQPGNMSSRGKPEATMDQAWGGSFWGSEGKHPPALVQLVSCMWQGRALPWDSVCLAPRAWVHCWAEGAASPPACFSFPSSWCENQAGVLFHFS